MKAVDCPTCKRRVEPEAKTFPFCSERCRLIDLGNWLGGNYRVAGEPTRQRDEEDEERDKSDN
jgi:endogenous inhibitor of DNA gyrase (YacG/DUF329 family)